MPITSIKHVTLQKTIAQEAPDAEGVYALYNREHELIYYGNTSESIRGRLLSHLVGNEGRCMQDAWYFNFEATPHSDTRARELLQEYREVHRALPKCNAVD